MTTVIVGLPLILVFLGKAISLATKSAVAHGMLQVERDIWMHSARGALGKRARQTARRTETVKGSTGFLSGYTKLARFNEGLLKGNGHAWKISTLWRRQFMHLATAPVIAQPAAADDAAEIRARLTQWTEDFNAGHKDAACDLFSKELISDFRGQGEANYATRCALIAKAIDDPAHKFQYQLHIKEIITSAELAVVRLDWTLKASPPGQKEVETGMDVFRKESDGAWRIIRYIAYEAPR